MPDSGTSVVAAVRDRWLLVVATTLLCAVVAGVYAYKAAPVYQSYVQLFVGFQGEAGNPALALQSAEEGGLFTVQAVQSYVDVATSTVVTAPVVQSLGLRMSPAELGHDISVSAPANTVLLNLYVNASNPTLAQRIAVAVGNQYATVIEQLQRASTTGPSPVRVSVSRPATLPTSPASPRKKVDIALGLILGLAIGIAAVLIAARLDTRIRDLREIERDDVPLLGVIPHDPKMRGHSDLQGALTTEAIRQLRTNLQFVNPDQPPQTIVVTSSIPSEGKTTTTLALARAIASTSARVVLVEGDLRKPTVASRLGLTSVLGLTDALISEKPVTEFLQSASDSPSLSILVAGTPVPNPSELLGSHRMDKLIAELRESGAMVLIDVPPLLPVTDGAVLASHADGVVVVAHIGRIRRHEIARALGALERVGANILGVVANQVPMKGVTRYGYGYRYGYGDPTLVVAGANGQNGAAADQERSGAVHASATATAPGRDGDVT